MTHNSYRRFLLTVLILLSFGACRTAPTSTPTQEPPPTPRPTTILEPASNYVAGQCRVPTDQYLFFRYSSHTLCAPACDCPAVEAPPSAINRVGDDIIYRQDQVIGSLAPNDPNSPAVGLISYGWFEEALYVIDALPFDVPNAGISIVSCEPTGRTVVRIAGKSYYLSPGQGWSSQSVRDEGAGCHRTYTISLSNTGLLARSRFRSDLSVRDEYVQLELAKQYFSIEEDISLAIRLIGEQGIDFSGFCMITFERQGDAAWEPVGDCSAVPDYVPEPFPRLPGEMIEIQLPTRTFGLKHAYQYELTPGTYRLKFAYAYSGGIREVYSPYFQVLHD